MTSLHKIMKLAGRPLNDGTTEENVTDDCNQLKLQDNIEAYFMNGNIHHQKENQDEDKLMCEHKSVEHKSVEELVLSIHTIIADMKIRTKSSNLIKENNNIESLSHNDTINNKIMFDSLKSLYLKCEEENLIEFSELPWSTLTEDKIRRV